VDEDGNTYQRRVLESGAEHELPKNVPAPQGSSTPPLRGSARNDKMTTRRRSTVYVHQLNIV